MYTFTELRIHLKDALNRARRSPVKILRRKEVFYLISERDFKQMVVNKVKDSLQKQQQSGELRYTDPEPYA